MDADEGDAYENNRRINKKMVNIPLSSPTTATDDGGGSYSGRVVYPFRISKT